MAAGCKNPKAINFSPEANPEDYSCVYMLKNQGDCHWFIDLVPALSVSNSFTMSWSLEGKSWVFFHDYLPDMYIHTREELFNTLSSRIYKHHQGPVGVYHNTTKPFFIDVVFQSETGLILETINWMTDFLSGTTDQPFSTLSHITIWNSHQHTSRIPVSKIQQFRNLTARNTKGQWVLNDFRNVLVNKGIAFLQDIFHDYLVVAAQVNTQQPWYNKELLKDKWFCVRFEFDNSTNNKIILHDTTVQAIKSDR